eukprot:CAMPEP_0118932512 /NCGR_PEP_ID=MMETSP1169-20130426/10465_1 /TAXON_ID=36882 /ORGANISM="Pyramimonas obovata, Strain CCMP722" /LENGTH=291 /DNA_ID=CAMNT_0006875181 /DNA_START=95 /DNA_END=970 /DNA_ORIENTATION=-
MSSSYGTRRYSAKSSSHPAGCSQRVKQLRGPSLAHAGRPTRWRVRSTIPSAAETSAAVLTADESRILKDKILQLASATDRGVSTPSNIAAGLCSCISELESINPTPDPNSLLDGDWILVWSNNIAPERANSPLFWAFRSFTDTLTQSGASSFIFQFTDVLKNGVGMSYGEIVQSISIDSEEFVSKVDLVAAPAFGVKLTGTVTTTAKVTANDSNEVKIKVINTRIVGGAVPGMDQVVFPYEPVFGQLLNAHNTVRGSEVQEPDLVTMRTTYIDQDMRVGRVDDDIFVYIRP